MRLLKLCIYKPPRVSHNLAARLSRRLRSAPPKYSTICKNAGKTRSETITRHKHEKFRKRF
jgi:hypothetical protein